MRLLRLVAAGLLLTLLGCGARGINVSGIVTQDGKPLPGAVVTFIPVGDTQGLGGSGITGADGKFVLQAGRAETGIAPGEYKVTVSRFLRKDGTPPPADVPLSESDARETLPAKYSDRKATTLKAAVGKEASSHEFNLDGPAN